MDVLAVASVLVHVGVGSDLAARNAREVSRNIEGKSAEFLHVHTAALAKVIVQVSDQGPPDDLHLQSGGQTIS